MKNSKPKSQENLRLSNEKSNQICRESLCEALIFLVSEKDFEKISITELVRRAGVSRATFYRNYATKNDILADIANALSAELEKFFSSNISFLDPFGIYLAFFEKCLEKKQIICAIFKSNSLTRNFLLIPSVLEQFKKSKTDADRYNLIAFEGAFFNLFKDWVLRGFAETPNQMAEICKNTLSKFE